MLECLVSARIPSQYGSHRLMVYGQHSVLVFGNYNSKSLSKTRVGDTPASRQMRGVFETGERHSPVPLVRIHSCCFTGETLGSLRCDCGEQLHTSMSLLSLHGGIILYLSQEGRGIGLVEKLKAYNLIDTGLDTLQANVALGHLPDARSYEDAASILADLGIDCVKLLTNNPTKVSALESLGVTVVERIPLVPQSWSNESDLLNGHPKSVTDSVLSTSIHNGNGLSNGHDSAQTNGLGNGLGNGNILGNILENANGFGSGFGSGGHVRTTSANSELDHYLATKVRKMGHLMDIPSRVPSTSPLTSLN